MTEQQFVALFEVLCQIRDALIPPEVELSGECPHPEETRVSLATPGDPDHWVCHVCRYEHVSLIRN